jgi:hypothetical protein
MTKLARRTHIPARWAQDELAPITHDDHLLPTRRLIAALDQDHRDRGHALGLLGKPVLERFGRCKQFAWNGAGGDTGGSVMP